jgi:hypothetical protein
MIVHWWSIIICGWFVRPWRNSYKGGAFKSFVGAAGDRCDSVANRGDKSTLLMNYTLLGKSTSVVDFSSLKELLQVRRWHFVGAALAAKLFMASNNQPRWWIKHCWPINICDWFVRPWTTPLGQRRLPGTPTRGGIGTCRSCFSCEPRWTISLVDELNMGG